MGRFGMLKRCLCLALFLLLCFTVCGCWDYRGLNQLIIVSGIALDKNAESDDYIITCEIMELSGNVKQEGIKAKIVESTGRTIAEAVHNANKRVVYRLYFGHCNTVLVSEEIALDGELEKLMDWILRKSDVRETASIVVSVGQSAAQLLKLSGIDQNVVSNEISRILDEDDKSNSLSFDVAAYEMYNLLKTEGISLALPVFRMVKNDEEMVVESNGLAVFKNATMVGMLSPLETKCFLFMINDVNGGILTCELPEKKGYFTLSIGKSSTKVTYRFAEDGHMIFTVKLKLTTYLSETAVTDEILQKETAEEYQTLAEQQLKEAVEETVKRVQREYGTDIFGLGNKINETDNLLWNTLKEGWEGIFRNTEVNVEPEIALLNTEYKKS